MFRKIFPSRSRGSGAFLKNSINTGGGQGITPPTLYAECKICGFILDTNVTDTSGGSWGAQGGYGEITVTETEFSLFGDSDVRKGSGCPFCGTKNPLK
jgi:hypothetical protein